MSKVLSQRPNSATADTKTDPATAELPAQPAVGCSDLLEPELICAAETCDVKIGGRVLPATRVWKPRLIKRQATCKSSGLSLEARLGPPDEVEVTLCEQDRPSSLPRQIHVSGCSYVLSSNDRTEARGTKPSP